jgi:hypothetical protein
LSLLYQANNTAFSAGALLRLYKITKKDLYKELSYLCLANIFKNVRLWDCNYGYGKNFPSFFTLFPLSDAPYSAVYEEQEVFCAFHDYLRHAQDQEILPSARLLMAEYIRFLVDRAVYYYPTQAAQRNAEGKSQRPARSIRISGSRSKTCMTAGKSPAKSVRRFTAQAMPLASYHATICRWKANLS